MKEMTGKKMLIIKTRR